MLVTSYWIEEHVRCQQGRNEGDVIPWALNRYVGTKKPQQFHK